MRRVPFALISCLLAAAPAVHAQDTTQSPYFFVKAEDPTVDQLPLKSTTVRAEIAGVVADVKVRQVYRNTGSRPLEASYVFPGSTRAAVHALTMRIGARTITAEIREKEQARKEYEQAKTEGKTASLLEQHRPNVFQMNVANILPGDEIEVELCYTELLVPHEGVYAFVYPTVVGPRYAGTPGTPSDTREPWVANPYTKAGEAALSTLDLEVRLAAGLPIARSSCDTHKTVLAYNGADLLSVRLSPEEHTGGNRDFIFKYQLSGGQVQSGLLLHRGKDENFFLVMAQPPARVTPAEMPPREYVFIMDVSGSQQGFPLEISKRLMTEMIRNLRPQDRFNVMVFEGSAAFWKPDASVAATPEHLQEALAFVRAQSGGGGTELASALRKALALPRTEGLSRSFVVSTDGFISADTRVLDLIRDNLGTANLFAFGIGSSVNRFLVEGMARAGQGEAFVITRSDQAEAEAARFRTYVSSPVLCNVRLKADGFDIFDVEPKALPDVLAARPVLAYGKWRGAPKGTLTVTGVGGQGPWQQVFDVAKVGAEDSHAALRQLWARQRIQRLTDAMPFGRLPEQLREVTHLGLTYHLLTEYTSFVAIDSQVRNPDGKPVPIVQPLPLPQGVSNAAVGGAHAAGTYGSPSVTGSNVRGGSGSAVVEVVATTAGCCAAYHHETFDVVTQPQATSSPRLKVGRVQSRSGVPNLEQVAKQLEQRLLASMGATQVARLPRDFTLVLEVDARGVIAAIQVGSALKTRLRELESVLVGFSLGLGDQGRPLVLTVPFRVLG